MSQQDQSTGGGEHTEGRDAEIGRLDRKVRWFVRLAWGVGAVTILILAIDLVAFWGDWTKAGVLGDFWGGHVGMGAGLVGVFLFVAALFSQQKELVYQRRDLSVQMDEWRESREVAKEHTEAAEKQAAQLAKQNELARQRDDAQLMMALGERAYSPLDPKQPYGNMVSNVAVIAFAIAECGKRLMDEPRHASALFLLFRVCCHPAATLREVVNQLDSFAKRHGHAVCGDGRTVPMWVDAQKKLIGTAVS